MGCSKKIQITNDKEELNKDESTKCLSMFQEKYDKKIKKLELDIAEQKEKADKISSMRDHIFEDLQDKEAQFNKKAEEYDLLIKKMDSQQQEYENEKKDLNKRIRVLTLKGERYDNIEKDLAKIHSKAQFDANKIIDDAKEQAMESIFTVDKVKKIIDEYVCNIHTQNKNIKDKSISNINEILIKQLNECITKLEQIKMQFLKDNNIID